MSEKVEIDYSGLTEEERNILISIESRKMIGEPTAADVISSQFGGNVKKYLIAMGEISS